MMPPWNSMSPQQQQQWLQLLMSRGTGGMQFGGAMGANPTPQTTMPTPMAGMPGGMMPIQTAPGFNPLANQAQQMNPAMLQYLMGMQGGGNGMQPTLAQLLQMRGTGLGL